MKSALLQALVVLQTLALLPTSTLAHPPTALAPLLPLTLRASTCVAALLRLTPRQIAGPFFIPAPFRSNISESRPGAPLTLTLHIRDMLCAPVANATVDIWHADVRGEYSAFRPEGEEGEDFMRGAQVTDADGMVRFGTIVPGWYPGRPVHVHVGVVHGEDELVTQLYFTNEVLKAVQEIDVYRERGEADTDTADERTPDALIMKDVVERYGAFFAEYNVGINVGDEEALALSDGGECE